MNADAFSVEARAKIHAALGDAARLAIADILATGDASPGEIGAHLGMPTNLVAHHLGVLADAGVIDRRRSEHDRRRSYLQLRPAAMAALNPPRVHAPRRVVFVCTRNSARSQLAAALWGQHSPIPVTSAGTEPATRANPRAVRTAKRHGLRIDPAATHHLDEVSADGDLLIAVCDHVHETLPTEQTRLHWSVPDPVPVDTDDAFEAAYIDLADRIERLIPTIEEHHP
ncbi:protein-tyrosine-phosphatase [Hamadaea flava]|uniref:MarR family transcriptional regulator n=1 Tax=Hamadaea flava TaxID=1742688 RepID=A0ABV8LQP3_9ACTN|nr:MarR family transcriptional regulator [Hamadaea flava]MCP2323282.1 protein-tyrosine-phosphatase [Hamadaea flava]